MTKTNFLKRPRFEAHGQNLIKYALMAGLVAVAAAAISPHTMRVALGRACAFVDGVAYVTVPAPPISVLEVYVRIGTILAVSLLISILVVPRRKD